MASVPHKKLQDLQVFVVVYGVKGTKFMNYKMALLIFKLP